MSGAVMTANKSVNPMIKVDVIICVFFWALDEIETDYVTLELFRVA